MQNAKVESIGITAFRQNIRSNVKSGKVLRIVHEATDTTLGWFVPSKYTSPKAISEEQAQEEQRILKGEFLPGHPSWALLPAKDIKVGDRIPHNVGGDMVGWFEVEGIEQGAVGVKINAGLLQAEFSPFAVLAVLREA